MKLKDFHETFNNDLQDREFVLGYLQDCLEEGGISLFISALKDIIKVYQANINNQDKLKEKESLLNDFLESKNPSFLIVYQVLKIIELDLRLESLSLTSTVT